MSFKPVLLAAVAATSLSSPAFAQSADRCASNATFGVTAAECTRYGGSVSASNECAMTPAQTVAAREEICLGLPSAGSEAGAGALALPATIIGIIGVGLAIAAAGGSSSSSTTTTTSP